MNKEADIMTPYPFVKITFNPNTNTTSKIKTIIGYSVGAILTKRDTIAVVTSSHQVKSCLKLSK